MNTENTERHAALVEAIGLANGESAASPPATEAPQNPPAETPEEHAQANAEAPEGDEHEDDSAASDGTDSPEAARPPRRNKLQERIDQLTREKYEATARAEAAEAQRVWWEKQQQAAAPERPTLEQFGYDHDAFGAALTKWAREDAARTVKAEAQQQEAQRQAAEQAAKVNERIEALEKESPGAWDEVTKAPINYTPHMFQALKASELGPKIGLYLARNLDEAHRITGLSPVQQVMAIARIEAQLATPAAAATPPSAPPRKTVTNAPPPPPALAAASKVATPLEEQSIEDRVKAIREFEARS